MKRLCEMNLANYLSLARHRFEKPGLIQLNLGRAIFGNFGILRTLSWFSRETERTHPGTSVECSNGIQETEIPDRLKSVLFRVVQEAVANAIRHGRPKKIRIEIRRFAHWLQLTVEDDGQGFGTRHTGKGSPYGLAQMQEEVDSTGGIFSVKSDPGEGTTVKGEWPCFRGATA